MNDLNLGIHIKKFAKNVTAHLSLKSLSKKNAFIIEGGGTRGVFAVGVLKYLFEQTDHLDLNEVHLFGGTSVGSYFATALSLGYDSNDISTISKIVDLGKLIDSKYLFLITFTRFLRKGYLYDDTGRKNIVKEILSLKIDTLRKDLGNDHIQDMDLTFGDLKNLIKQYPCKYKHLLINTVDISTGEQLFLTTLNDNFDNIKLFDAMLASSAIPFVFEPTILYQHPDNSYGYVGTSETTMNHLIDGGISTNNPLDYFLLNREKMDEYNIWLLKFTTRPKYVEISTNLGLLEHLISYLIGGKTNINMDLVQDEYHINTININSKAGTLDIYTPEQIQQIISEIYGKCVKGEITFKNETHLM